MPRPRGKAGQRAYYPRSYTDWRERVGWQIKAAFMELKGRKITSPVSVRIVLHRDGFSIDIERMDGDRHGLTGDVDNYAKAILDIMQEVGVIENDSQVESLAVAFLD